MKFPLILEVLKEFTAGSKIQFQLFEKVFRPNTDFLAKIFFRNEVCKVFSE